MSDYRDVKPLSEQICVYNYIDYTSDLPIPNEQQLDVIADIVRAYIFNSGDDKNATEQSFMEEAYHKMLGIEEVLNFDCFKLEATRGIKWN